MNKKVFKTLMISFILMCSVFFVGNDEVKADRENYANTCYFYAGKKYRDSYVGTGGANTSWADYHYGGIFAINITSNGKVTVTDNCLSYAANSNEAAGGCSPSSDKVQSELNPNDFKTVAAEIVKNNYSLASCANLNSMIYAHYESNTSVKKATLKKNNGTDYSAQTNNPNANFIAISSNHYYALKNAAKFKDKANELGLDDRTNLESYDSSRDLTSEDYDAQKTTAFGALQWANKITGTKDKGGKESTTCDIFGTNTIKFVYNLFLAIQIIGIVLLIVLTSVDFVKAVIAADEDGLKKAFKSLYRRIIVVVLLLMLPTLVTWILNMINANQYQYDEHKNFVIGADGNPLCKN